MTEEVKTINFNGTEYNVEDLSDKAKYFIGQLNDLQLQGQQTRARLDQIEVASRGFTDLLGQELEKPEEGEVV
jgi:hypothetical protein